jgi:hypothetical protein
MQKSHKNGIFHQCFYDHAIIKSDTSKLITSLEILFVKTMMQQI